MVQITFREKYKGKINLDKFIEMRKQGVKGKELAKHFDTNMGHIGFLIKELKLSKKYKKNKKINLDEFKKMYKEGIACWKMAEHFETYVGHIGYLIKEMNLSRRGKGKLSVKPKKTKLKLKPKRKQLIPKQKLIKKEIIKPKPLPSINLIVHVPCFCCEGTIVHCVRNCKDLGDWLTKESVKIESLCF